MGAPRLRQPAEWERHGATWLAWPSHEDLWGDALPSVQRVVVELVHAVGAGEEIRMLVPNARAREAAEEALRGERVAFFDIPFGDIWLRDTAPVFVHDGDGSVRAVSFGFNGWGGKYILHHDSQVASRIQSASGFPGRVFPLVLEGGSIEVDGEGTALTTKQCLLNPNRNPGYTRDRLESAVAIAFGCSKVVWLSEGLENDHTDGHIDTLARFVSPGTVIAMAPRGASDPNERVLRRIIEELSEATDARGRRIRVVTIPSPGRIEDATGRVMPASYANFYIANSVVAVPTYHVPEDREALAAISAFFPTRSVIGIDARRLLEGGGAIHCITQQEPCPRDQP